MSLVRRHVGWGGEPWASDPALAAFRFDGTARDDRIKGTALDDYVDVSQGGDDRVQAFAGNDTVYFGAAFTGADRVVGGMGTDTVILDGDYSAGIEVRADSLTKIERLVLEGGSYVLTGDLKLEGGTGYMVDARTLDATQSLHLDVSSLADLSVFAGAGRDVLHASRSGTFSQLFGADGDDVLIGGSGPSKLIGGVGADTIEMSNAGDVAVYGAPDSIARRFDTIENFAASGGRIELIFDSDTDTDGFQLNFHLGRTAERVGDIVVKYNAAHDETIVKVFTDHDNKADFVLHLTGDVPLTPADFIFG